MQVTIKSKNLELTDQLKTYIERKVNKLDRYMPNLEEARVDLAVQNAKSAQDRQVAQLTLRNSAGVLLRVEERSADMQSAIDAVLDKMSRQIDRYKGKHWRSNIRQQTESAGPVEIVEEEEETEGAEVVRTKRFQTRPMDVQEAIEQMELLGHDFFAFYDATTENFSVVYRRKGGGYGLLLPELT